MKARGLVPKEADEDDLPPKSKGHSLSESKQPAIKPGTGNKLVNDNDLPPSTLTAPSLSVPIITHASKGGSVQQLYDERNTRVSASIIIQ